MPGQPGNFQIAGWLHDPLPGSASGHEARIIPAMTSGRHGYLSAFLWNAWLDDF